MTKYLIILVTTFIAATFSLWLKIRSMSWYHGSVSVIIIIILLLFIY